MSFKFYLSGPTGCGKSLLLYQLACRLMSTDEYAVVYVQFSSLTLITEIARALYFECKSLSDPLKNIEELKELAAKSRKQDLTSPEMRKLYFLIEDVKSQLEAQNRTLVFIIDQTNNLLSDNNLADKVTFIQTLFKKQMFLISGSANNETENFPNVLPEMVRLPFSNKELKTFIVLHRPENEHNEWCDEQIVSQILGITGAVAIEINRFVNGSFDNYVKILPVTTLSQRFNEYKKFYNAQYNISTLKRWYKKKELENEAKGALMNIQRLDFVFLNLTFFINLIIIDTVKFEVASPALVS